MIFLTNYCDYYLFRFKFFYCRAFDMLAAGDEVDIKMLSNVAPELKHLDEDSRLAQRLKIEALYEYAVAGQAQEVAEMHREEALLIPRDLDYNSNKLNLSFEEREKLLAVQPQTVRKIISKYCCIVLLCFN